MTAILSRVKTLLFLEGINHLKPGLGKKGNLLAKDSKKSRDVQACSGMAGSELKLCQQDLVFLFLLVLFPLYWPYF